MDIKTTQETTAQPPFAQALAAWLQALTQQEAARFAKHYPNLKPGTFEVMVGPKYVRIVQVDGQGTSRRSFAFVDRETGDILKSASWKKPAQGARGSIYKLDTAPLEYGAMYR